MHLTPAPKTTDLPESFGARLTRMRRRAGYRRQDDLAKIIGSSLNNISRWETGGSYPSSDSLHRLSEALDVSMDELWTGDPRHADLTIEGQAKLLIEVAKRLMEETK